jgi:hypothetical protein
VVILRAGGVHPRSTTSPRGCGCFCVGVSRAPNVHPSLPAPLVPPTHGPVSLTCSVMVRTRSSAACLPALDAGSGAPNSDADEVDGPAAAAASCCDKKKLRIVRLGLALGDTECY